MLPSIITLAQPASGKQRYAARSRAIQAENAHVVQAGPFDYCTPCVLGQRVCCRLDGLSVRCGLEPC